MRSTIAISSGDEALRTGLRVVLDRESALCVVGEASTAEATLKLVIHCTPDVIVVDLAPCADAWRLLSRIRARSQSTRILAVSASCEPSFVQEAVAAGVWGYLDKAQPLDDLVRSIHAVGRGYSVLSVPLPAAGLTPLLSVDIRATRAMEPFASDRRSLSERERQVLAHFARGETHRQIASCLGVSTKTVETYRSRLGHKFGARTRGDLIRCALALGLLEPSEAAAAP